MGEKHLKRISLGERGVPHTILGRLGGGLIAAMAIVASLVLLSDPAGAQDDDAPSSGVSIRLQYDDADGETVPATDVTVSLLDTEGNEVANGATDENGEIVLEAPAGGDYEILLDDATLPDGVSLRNPDRNPLAISVDEGRVRAALIPLIEGEGGATDSGGSTVRRVLQLSVEGIKLGLFLGMAAIGLSLIFGTTGLTNFAHGEMVAWGALSTYLFNYYGLAGFLGFMAGWPLFFGHGVNLVFAIVLSAIVGGLTGFLLDRGLFRPLRARQTSLIAQLVITIGLSILWRYVMLYIFGGSPRQFRDFAAQRALSIGPIEITPKDLTAVILSVGILVLVGVLLQATRIGKAMRAVADNRDLAESSGIDVQRVITYVWVSGGALAALAGSFIGLGERIGWDIGFRLLLLIFAGVTLGGLGTAYGALVGSLIIGMGIQLSTLFIPNELKNVGALAALIVILTVRPQGLLGTRERIG